MQRDDAHQIIITPEIACKLIDPGARAVELEDHVWTIESDPGQAPGPLAEFSLLNEDPICPCQTEAEAWAAAELFLIDRLHQPGSAHVNMRPLLVDTLTQDEIANLLAIYDDYYKSRSRKPRRPRS